MDFSQAKNLMKLQQEAQKIKDELSNIHIEAEVGGVVATIDGEMKIISITIEDESLLSQKALLEKNTVDAINKGMKKSQEIAAEKMKGVMGQMGLDIPGMGM